MNNLWFKEIRQNMQDHMDRERLSGDSNSGYSLNKYLFITCHVSDTNISKGRNVKKKSPKMEQD